MQIESVFVHVHMAYSKCLAAGEETFAQSESRLKQVHMGHFFLGKSFPRNLGVSNPAYLTHAKLNTETVQ
jgi:hypothetical protein